MFVFFLIFLIICFIDSLRNVLEFLGTYVEIPVVFSDYFGLHRRGAPERHLKFER